MKLNRRYILILAALSLLLGLVSGGCSEDEAECPVCPGTPSPTLDNLWPNDDGNSWTYDQVMRRWETAPWTLYEVPGDVPDAPSLDYVEARIGDLNTGVNADTMSYIIRLEFDGTCEGDSGATGQCLVETLFDEWDDDITMVSFDQVFFSRLLVARPDLEDEISSVSGMNKAPAGPGAVLVARMPLILHGGVWGKTSEYIGTYGDIDTLLAWKFLESDISVGHEFIFQLIPSLASDVFLHCRVLSHGTVETGYGKYENAVECLYLIDHGISTMEPLEGTRYFRVYDYGTIIYAPGVGPVLSYERMLIDAAVPDGPGYGDFLLELIGTGSD
jgi:hypothetical protein